MKRQKPFWGMRPAAPRLEPAGVRIGKGEAEVPLVGAGGAGLAVGEEPGEDARAGALQIEEGGRVDAVAERAEADILHVAFEQLASRLVGIGVLLRAPRPDRVLRPHEGEK
ncbi:hypothetical protein [Coriobacterium glomerans]|uniref:hypothetical protein n=1 Tax=Coriobacterium glomerans TaxID=33871 RepID=UPI0012EA50A1|nr:hypothetical protein [Coriobacterium glomerans]